MELKLFCYRFVYFLVRYLELQSSALRSEIRFSYTPVDAKHITDVKTEIFSYNLSDEKWHNLSLIVSGREIQLLVDCHLIDKRLLDRIPDRNFSASGVNIFIGERNRNFLFNVRTQQNFI